MISALNALIIGVFSSFNKSFLLNRSIKSSHLTAPLENSIEYTVFGRQQFVNGK